MIKRGLIPGILVFLIVSVESYFSQNWNHIYYVCGSLGLMSIGLSAAYFVDGLILGNKGTLTSNKETRKLGRYEQSKGFILMGIPNLLAALIYIIM